MRVTSFLQGALSLAGFEESSYSLLWAACREVHVARNWGKLQLTSSRKLKPHSDSLQGIGFCPQPYAHESGSFRSWTSDETQPWSIPWLQPCRWYTKALGLFFFFFLRGVFSNAMGWCVHGNPCYTHKYVAPNCRGVTECSATIEHGAVKNMGRHLSSFFLGNILHKALQKV